VDLELRYADAQRRFGPLPESVRERLEQADADRLVAGGSASSTPERWMRSLPARMTEAAGVETGTVASCSQGC
jgi:hypothetical protein